MTLPQDVGSGSALHLRIVREESLRQRLLAHDERALIELIDHASPWVVGTAQQILHDTGDAEEVAMDVFRLAWEHIDTIAVVDIGLMPWLLTVTRRRAIDRLRARTRRTQRQLRFLDAEGAPGSVAAAEPDEAGQPGWHIHSAVHQALEALPTDQRSVIHLAYFNGLTHSEIATTLGVPLGTVKGRLRIACDKLRSSLASIRDWVL